MSTRRLNANSSSLTGDRNNDLSDMAQQALEDRQVEQQSMGRERLDMMQQGVHHEIGSDNDLATRMAKNACFFKLYFVCVISIIGISTTTTAERSRPYLKGLEFYDTCKTKP